MVADESADGHVRRHDDVAHRFRQHPGGQVGELALQPEPQLDDGGRVVVAVVLHAGRRGRRGLRAGRGQLDADPARRHLLHPAEQCAHLRGADRQDQDRDDREHEQGQQLRDREQPDEVEHEQGHEHDENDGAAA